MKILHVISAPSIGGIEAYVKDLAKEMVKGGHSMHIGFLDSAAVDAASRDFQSHYLSELEAAGIEYFFLGKNVRRCIWRGIENVRQYVVMNGIDVYHSHLTYGILCGMRINVPRVYTHHSIDMRVGRVFFQILNPMIDQLIGISDNCSSALSMHARRDVLTVLNGVDLNKFDPKSNRPRENLGDINCIAVGRICVEKNYELLVHAVSLLPADILSRLTVRLVGAGSEAMTASLKKEISDNDVGSTISMLGSRNDVPELLASSQLFLMSSSSEGLPIALIEAAASGLPCVVTDAGGCREIVERCQNGIVVSLDSPQEFAEAIEKVIGDPEKFSEYSTNAIAYSRQFSIEKAASMHVSMYRRLLAANT